MAEYITIMLINGKAEEQINSELMDRMSKTSYFFAFTDQILLSTFSNRARLWYLFISTLANFC